MFRIMFLAASKLLLMNFQSQDVIVVKDFTYDTNVLEMQVKWKFPWRFFFSYVARCSLKVISTKDMLKSYK